MHKLYPLKFKPIFKDKIWGGQKIKTVLNMDYSPLPNCGEVWVLSGVEGDESTIQNGFLEGNELNEIVEVYMGDLVGERVFQKFGSQFPILIKFIDANDWLSIQVHPDDELAWKRHNSQGKSEMWYILDAEKDAQLISGFSEEVNKYDYQKHLENHTLKEILNFEKVSKGDVYYMPAGRIHALGPGVLLAEIQQTSDITYRIYDWDRIDEKGMQRELHTELALDAIDFRVQKDYKTHYEPVKNETTKVVESPHFLTSFISLTKAIRKDFSEIDSFVIYICVKGSAILKNDEGEIYPFGKGEVILVPAFIDSLEIHPTQVCDLLEVYIP